ncbi:MAG: ferrous iron transporter B, partial [Firmicutes bacterium]|nr:ferrous iron transporter B [Bacillota bacterium]
QRWMESGVGVLNTAVMDGLTGASTSVWLVSLVGAIIMGLGGVLVFLPQIALLFFFLAMLEDSGYLARVAYMTDGIFAKIGLSGRSVFTMLMGFGCSATAVLTARNLEDERVRRKTVLLTPFMSCSARLPVYSVILGSVFLGAGHGMLIFAFYLLGASVALLMAWIFEKIPSWKSGSQSFIMELPPYRIPTAGRVFRLLWNNISVFLLRIGTVIFALNVLVWVLTSFTFGFKYAPDSPALSILGKTGGVLKYLFVPLGFGTWEAAAALLCGLAAKESVVSSLQIITGSGAGALFAGFAYPKISAISFLIFVLLYVPCVATVASIGRELGAKWAWFSVAFNLVAAYVFALAFYWAALFFTTARFGVILTVCIAAAIAVVTLIIIFGHIRRRGVCIGCRDPYCKDSGKCTHNSSDQKSSDKKH